MISVGEYGFRLTLVTGYDFSGFSNIDIVIEKPDGTTSTKGASTTDATAGELYWTVTSGFFDTPGMYEAQAIIEFAGKRLKSDRVSFRVHSALS